VSIQDGCKKNYKAIMYIGENFEQRPGTAKPVTTRPDESNPPGCAAHSCCCSLSRQPSSVRQLMSHPPLRQGRMMNKSPLPSKFSVFESKKCRGKIARQLQKASKLFFFKRGHVQVLPTLEDMAIKWEALMTGTAGMPPPMPARTSTTAGSMLSVITTESTAVV
jgi:hypothetical protein